MQKYKLVVLCWSALLCVRLPGQVSAASGSISGLVSDPQGRVIPRVSITVKSSDQGFVRAGETGTDGGFTVPALPPGTYVVTLRARGFELRQPVRVVLALNAQVRLSLRMALAGVSQETTVRSARPTQEGNTVPQEANRETAEIATSLAGLTITYLPSRSRQIAQLTEYAPGVVSLDLQRGWAIAGQRPGSSSAAVDGAEMRDGFRGGVRGAEMQLPFFPQTAVREVEIVEAGASAEIGGTSGGFVNIATKSGTDKTRGEAFYIGRPSTLTGADAFGRSMPSQQHLFGGSQGGPIRRGKVFYYVGLEEAIEDVSTFVEFAPQGIALPSGLQSREQDVVGRAYSTAVSGRVDALLGSRNTLSGSFNYNFARQSNQGVGSSRSLAAAENLVGLHRDAEWVRIGLSSTFRSSAVNQLLGQWSRDAVRMEANSPAPEIAVNGLGVFGGNSVEPQTTKAQRQQVADDLAFAKGGSLFHMGMSFADLPAYQDRLKDRNGRFDYTSLADYLAGRPRRYRQTFVTGRGTYDASQQILGLYGTARLPLTRTLHLTAGLRWDGQWNPQPGAAGIVAGSRFVPDDLTQWQPRLGLAWAPGGRITVRASAGILSVPTPGSMLQRIFVQNGAETISLDSYFDPTLLAAATTGNGLGSVPAMYRTDAVVYGMDPGFRNARTMQSSVGAQVQTSRSTDISASHVHASSWKLARTYDRNLGVPTIDPMGTPVFPAARPLAGVGRYLVEESAAHSHYDGLLIAGNWKMSQRSFVAANYTLSKTIDDDSGEDPYGSVTALNPFAPRLERSAADFDVRHTLNVNAIVNLPRGFKLNPLLVARSGLPYTPIIGFDTQGDANDANDRAILNGRVASRNSLRQPVLYAVDLRLVKDFTLKGEGHHLDLFVDWFNVTAASNRSFGPDDVSVYGSATAPVFSAGQPLFAPNTTMFGSARQVQFTARLVGF